jgi:hypothetical protein
MSKSKRKGEKLVKTAIQLSELGGITGDGSKKHARKLKKFNKTSKQHDDTLRKPSRDVLRNPDNYLIGTPIKQVGIVNPLTGQPVQQMTNVPPAQSNTLGNAQPVFNAQAQQAAQGVYGSVDQRQNSVGATPLFQEQQFWKSHEHVEPAGVKKYQHRPEHKEIHNTIKNTSLFQEEKTIPNPAPIVEPAEVEKYEPIPKIKKISRT